MTVKWPIQLRADASDQIYRYQAIQLFTGLTSSNIAGVGAGTFFTFGGLNGAARLAAVFDQYRVTRLQIYITPPFTQITESTPDNAMFSSVVDLDDAGNPATHAAVQSKPGCVTTSICMGHYHSWQPMIAASVYTGAFGGFGDLPSGTSLDCANTNVQYYGLKAFVDTTQTNNLFFRYTVVFDVELRGCSLL